MDQAAQRALFISCAGADEAWVRYYLIPELGLTPDRVLTRRDFRLGQSIAREVERAVSSSRYTVLVLSRAYLTDEWAGFGEDLATWSGLEGNAAKLIPLALEPIDIPLRLQFRVRLDCTSEDLCTDAARRLREFLLLPEPGPEPVPPCPYPGMRPFDAKEKDQYFGRSALVQSTIERLRLQSFLALIGPSGSGKSSFLHAGLVPKLNRNALFASRGVQEVQFRPGSKPLAKLAALLGKALAREPADVALQLEREPESTPTLIDEASAKGPDDALWLLVVDQFEEVFAPSVDVDDRLRFFRCLDAALAAPPERCRVIIAIRADFYDDCQESMLWPRIEAGLLNLPPLSRDGLREAIREPAARSGVFVEPALVERLIDDAEDEPGPLPLLQEAMVLLWSSHLRRRLLTLASYDRLSVDGHSGLQIAMRDRAEATIRNLTRPGQEEIARRIFVRLTEFAERRNTRRQQSLDELMTTADNEPAVRAVIDVLVTHGLLTTDRDETTGEPLVDLAHEKLIEAWPRLATWLDDYEPIEAERRSLVHAASSWEENHRERSYTFTGRRLKQAAEWTIKWPGEVGEREEQFLDASKRADRIRTGTLLAATLGSIVVVVAGVLLAIRSFVIPGQTASSLLSLPAGPAIISSDNPELQDRQVTLGGFRIEMHEVSNGQYRQCDDNGPCDPPVDLSSYEAADLTGHPVVAVTPLQAQAYCIWLGRRLPSAGEWERAVRGTHGRPWPWVGDLPQTFEMPEMVVPVESLLETRTPEGVYNLIDNVAEWVTRSTPDEFARAGGAWDIPIDSVSEVINSSPASWDPSIGFRCAADGA